MRIAVTAGEPAGIGPELCVHLASHKHAAELVFICDPDLLQRAAQRSGKKLDIELFDPDHSSSTSTPGKAVILPISLVQPSQWGVLNSENARYVLQCLDVATQGCIDGDFDAMVTAPLHKGIINDAGIPFTGHTEYLAAATGSEQVVMLLVAGNLRVALATTHLPLSRVSQAITAESLRATLVTLEQGIRTRFGVNRPRISVCGLNPHAGEGGYLGVEDRDVIAPLLETLRSEGLDLVGPLPADTAFTPRQLAHTDAVLAMFHDQGLPVLKYAGFGSAVNVTLGLPIIRTSVDHGTALDLAGKGKADPGSMEAALKMAMSMVHAGRPATQHSS